MARKIFMSALKAGKDNNVWKRYLCDVSLDKVARLSIIIGNEADFVEELNKKLPFSSLFDNLSKVPKHFGR